MGLPFPGVFALGTALPVVALAMLLESGAVDMGQLLKRFKAADVRIQWGVGVVFLLIGVNEIVLYWFL